MSEKKATAKPEAEELKEAEEAYALLSVVIPVRNNSTSSLRMLGELHNQRVAFGLERKVRVIVIDDASDDLTARVLSGETEKLDFTLIKPWNERRGAGAARNYGAHYAAEMGTLYVAFIDADDYLNGEALKLIAEKLELAKPDSLIWGFSIINPDGMNAIWLPKFRNIEDYPQTPVAPWIHATRPHLLAPFPEGLTTDDVIWWIRQADILKSSRAAVAVIDGKPLYIYDKTQGGCTRAQMYFERHPTTLETAAVENTCAAHGFPDRFVSDTLRNLAAMYDLRHEISDPDVRKVWLNRFRQEIQGIWTGRYCW